MRSQTKRKNEIWFFDKGQNNWIMSVIYFSLFNIRSGTLHFTNRINMNITSSHKLADNQHKIWGTVLNQKDHASMKEINHLYNWIDFSITKTKLHLLVFSSLKRKTKQQQQKGRNVKKSQTLLGTPIHRSCHLGPWNSERGVPQTS